MNKSKENGGKKKKKSSISLQEEDILSFWKEKKIFEKSLEKESPKGTYIFFDGPPFATGLPHWGSLLSSVSKDVIGRYKTMRGYTVPRRWGWDCHGLPIETLVEKKLGIKSKKEIEKIGIEVFNKEARHSVLEYTKEWKHYVERVGRWVDFDNSYKTMDNSYMESVWWALKKIYTDKKLYEGKKVLMYCPRCETPLSKSEIAMDNSYKEVKDTAVFVTFPLEKGQKIKNEKGDTFIIPQNTHIIAWTTTPWTLPANTALAVKKDAEYSVQKKGEKYYILAKEKVEKDFFGEKGEEVFSFLGSALLGLSYSPLYKNENIKEDEKKNAYHIFSADFVTEEEGTGIVHIAPAYGEDDFLLSKEHSLPLISILDERGVFLPSSPSFLSGVYYKKGGMLVLEDLEKRGLFFEKEEHTHSYPHCYRCSTPLIYNALTSWFIDIQKVKKDLIEKNKEISWYPSHLKYGRFGKNIENAPDWTISRNRFWASPLPIWKNEKTHENVFIGSIEELKKYTKRSGNKYIFMRHGEAENNTKKIISSLPENPHHLTEKGKEQVKKTADILKDKNITKIIVSPLLRTKETAGIVAENIGYKKEIIEDSHFGEWFLKDYNNLPLSVLREKHSSLSLRFTERCGKGETLEEMKTRVGEGLYALEEKYKNETILIITHEYIPWLAECIKQGATNEESVKIRGEMDDYVKNAELREIDFIPLPHNEKYELDLHRPYIDEIQLNAEDGTRLLRIPEVVDCWVESASMPFASEGYPQKKKEEVEKSYPGDFIAEYIAQTRTWFYYMHALGVLLFGKRTFTHCLTTGNLLSEDGSKVSKSKKNYTDPLLDMDAYGADASRFYLLGSVVMQAEDASFTQEGLRSAYNKYINMLFNTYSFYALYKKEGKKEEGKEQKKREKENILDIWITIRLKETKIKVEKALDEYATVDATRFLQDFVNDMSLWYVRRSRERLKDEENKEEYENALETLRLTLLHFAKITAPITPFIAETIYKGVGGEKESVHLENWEENEEILSEKEKDILKCMQNTREITSLILEKRQKAGIKVRQPLLSATFSSPLLYGKKDFIDIICQEVNVKNIKCSKEGEDIMLETELTPELIREGEVREFLRAVQAMRKKQNKKPEEKIILDIVAGEKNLSFLEYAKPFLKKTAGVEESLIKKEKKEGKEYEKIQIQSEDIFFSEG